MAHAAGTHRQRRGERDEIMNEGKGGEMITSVVKQ